MKLAKHPLALELIWVLALLLVGILLLPALIFVVGSRLFGAYSTDNSGLSTFYLAFAHDLAAGQLSAWLLALGPLLLIYLLRLTLGWLRLDLARLFKPAN